ncbi:MAG: MBL fold metallo-hydrolase [Alphaproteobacteria bacterium]|uniref:MBL fold metallo-hydrolase n=1 Tax=Candidatus Nitrobium versatile TaxID=2884831 RepID=A0A953M114_9BACT|nr:MBL fold metallo-hydrolase [Candidatus Nitrobium versatile]
MAPLMIVIHDVGHGQAIHAFTPDGKVVVIDLGMSASFSPLEWLGRYTKTIDSLVITHPHGDHIDEILLITDLGFNVRQLWRPRWLLKQDVYAANQATYYDKLNAYFDMSDRYNSPVKDGELVGDPKVTGGVTIKQFASRNCGTSNINNHSGVVVFEYLGVRVVVPGDNEAASWKELLKKTDFVNMISDTYVFMASHHGRQSGYCLELFSALNDGAPRLCVISDAGVQDTDATQRYSCHAEGWAVDSRSTLKRENRNCVTTRTDGAIEIEVGSNLSGTYLSVTTD